MYYDFKVPIPYEKGKIYKIFKKSRNTTYIEIEYGNTYYSDRKYSIGRRAIIGKMCSDDSDLMFPNDNYYKYLPDAIMPETRDESYRSCCLRIGSYAVIKKIAEDYGLLDLLVPIIPEKTGLLLDLAVFSIITEDNACQYYPDFAFCHPLFSEGMRIFSDSSVSRFLRGLTIGQRVSFLNEWNDGRDHRQRIYISYDSTNKNSEAGDIDFVEYGHPKVDAGLPVLNISVAYDKMNRVPLFYEEYPGSITDIAQFRHMVGSAKGYGYKHVGFILDRGYFGKENIQYMDECGYDFLIMVKGQKKLVSELILSRVHTFESDRECAIKPYRAYGTTVKRKLYADDDRERYFHIYYNPYREATERDLLEKRLSDYEKIIKRYEGQAEGLGPAVEQYFEVFRDKDGKVLFAKERTKTISTELSLCGYFTIISSSKMSAKDALVLYKSRDSSEKLFSSDKSFLGGKSFRVHSNESVSSKIFISFIALIIRTRIYSLLKDEMLERGKKSNFMTVPKALKELEKIEMVRRTDGVYRLDHAVTATQKAILGAFGMNEDDILGTARQISELLGKGGDLTDLVEEKGDDWQYVEDEDDYLC